MEESIPIRVGMYVDFADHKHGINCQVKSVELLEVLKWENGQQVARNVPCATIEWFAHPIEISRLTANLAPAST